MPIVLEAVSMEDYTKWVDKKKLAQEASKNTSNIVLNMEELMTKGEKSTKRNVLFAIKPMVRDSKEHSLQ